MLESPKLTARQQQILNLIQAAIASTGAPPTRAEIATELGFKSANAAEEHLQALARKGVIELVSGTSRGIRLRGDVLRSINESRSKQFSMSLPSMAQLGLPLIGRVAAGSPILAQEHVDRTYYVENSLFQHQPDYLLKVRGMSMRDAGIMDGDLLAVQELLGHASISSTQVYTRLDFQHLARVYDAAHPRAQASKRPTAAPDAAGPAAVPPPGVHGDKS